MLWRERYSCFIIFLIFFSCSKDKKYEDFNENDFYEVQGVITKVYRTPSVFDSSYNMLMDYSYAVNDSIFLNGSEKEFYKAWSIGQPIVVLVHKNDFNINFYARDGVVSSFSEKQLDMFNTILEIEMNKK